MPRNVDPLLDQIFFEKQIGQLCAQHALNMLLQDSYFTAVDLAEIAQDLDRREIEVLSPEERLNFKSQNLDDSGFFSIQVMTEALQRSMEMCLIPLDSPQLSEIKANPRNAKAFICNLNEHWFTLRKFGEQWIVLNSLTEGPYRISDTYLALYLAQLTGEGYSIFVVVGEIPHTVADEAAKEYSAIEESKMSYQQSSQSNDANDEEELQLALSISRLESEGVDNVAGENTQLDEALQRALHESLIDSNSSHASCSKSVPREGNNTNAFPDNVNRVTSAQPQFPVLSDAELLRQRRENFLKRFDN